MKKIFLYILVGSLSFAACKSDSDESTYVEPEDIAVQNTYDDQAIQKFLNDNYLDAQGNIKAFSSSDASDDNETKLADLSPVTLPSGVVYIKREGAQPAANTGKTLATGEYKDVIKLMLKMSYNLAGSTDGNVSFITSGDLVNTINGTSSSGSPVTDPMYYYVKNSFLEAATTDVAKQRSYYEIEGFQEGLSYFQSFIDKPNGDPYNLQGVIIVPSRAAFARDSHYNYNGVSFRNMTFIFNFQLYDAKTRTDDQK
ncbi:hypothetical protein [Chryseobacterium sp.]|uniref:hypothetical protein n=1 Tax=Chryseobacterium sp. TaxID=1871047 RepID=UPI0025C61B69|nr:hypothetical protein [Chryseobacterium sp.]